MQVIDKDVCAVPAVTGLKLQIGGKIDAPTVAGGFPKSGLDQSNGHAASGLSHIAADGSRRSDVSFWPGSACEGGGRDHQESRRTRPKAGGCG
jgi:hypothetical protein